jgi:predicted GTPase
MDAVVLCEVKFGAQAVQAAIDHLIVEKKYRILGAALIAADVPEDFTLDVPFVAAPGAAEAVREAAAEFRPRAIVDVTEAGLADRFRWANEALQLGLEVHGADYRLWPPAFKGRDFPSVMFVGAGAAAGKTAAIVHLLRSIKDRYRAAAVVLDLGGPSYAELVEPGEPASAAARFLAAYRDGRNVGGDHYLIAAATGVPAVGCPFAGTGLTGVPLDSLLTDAFVFASEAGGEFVVVEGSGGAMPAAEGEMCFLVNHQTDPAVLREFPFAYQLRRAGAVVATGFTSRPAASAVEALQAEVKAANAKAAFSYGRLEAEAVGPSPFTRGVVVTARPEDGRTGLASYWGRKVKGEVLEVVGAEQFPPAAPLTKVIRQGPGEIGLIVDMAAANLGEWLVWAEAWGVPVLLTYEVLTPDEPVCDRLVQKAVRAAK